MELDGKRGRRTGGRGSRGEASRAVRADETFVTSCGLGAWDGVAFRLGLGKVEPRVWEEGAVGVEIELG